MIAAGTFGARLRAAIRDRYGPGQERSFARLVDMDPTQLSRVLNNRTERPEMETLARFARGLGVPLEDVIGWSVASALAGSTPHPAAPRADDPLAEIVARVRGDGAMMEQLVALQERCDEACCTRVTVAVADVWRTSLMLMLVGTQVPGLEQAARP